MALVPCRECGKPVSEKAAACPHCGAPITTKTAAPAPEQRKEEMLVIPPDKRKGCSRTFLIIVAILLTPVVAIVIAIVFMASSESRARTELERNTQQELTATWLRDKPSILASAEGAKTPEGGIAILKPYLKLKDADAEALHRRLVLQQSRNNLALGRYDSLQGKIDLMTQVVSGDSSDKATALQLKNAQKELKSIQDMYLQDLCVKVRDRKHQQAKDDYAMEFVRRGGSISDFPNIRNNHVEIGMSEISAICAFTGEFTDYEINRTRTDSGETHQIVFSTSYGPFAYVYAEHGIVTAVQD